MPHQIQNTPFRDRNPRPQWGTLPANGRQNLPQAGQALNEYRSLTSCQTKKYLITVFKLCPFSRAVNLRKFWLKPRNSTPHGCKMVVH